MAALERSLRSLVGRLTLRLAQTCGLELDKSRVIARAWSALRNFYALISVRTPGPKNRLLEGDAAR